MEISIHYMHGQPVDDHQIKAVKDARRCGRIFCWNSIRALTRLPFVGRRPRQRVFQSPGGARRALRHPRAHVAQAGPVATHILYVPRGRARFLSFTIRSAISMAFTSFRVMTPLVIRRKIDFAEGRRLLKIDVPAGGWCGLVVRTPVSPNEPHVVLNVAAGLSRSSLTPCAFPQTRDEQCEMPSSFPNILN